MSESRIHVDGLKPADVALLKSVAQEAAEQAVQKTFIAMGLDPTSPKASQADMVWLRTTRERCETAGFKAVLTFVGLLVVGAVGAFWIGFKALVTGHGH